MIKRMVFMLASSAVLLLAADPSPAASPAGYRTNTLDPRAQRVPPEIQRGVFADPDRHLEPLVKFLIAEHRDDFHKVKILHDWVAENIAYDVGSYFSGVKADSSVASTLRRRRGVCYGYATLFREICALARIPCEKISGFGRGYGFAAGRGGNTGDVNHAWNAVQIDERWYLVDVTWDAGHVEGRSFRKEYRTTYLFLDPHHFVYTHLPSEPKWQLLSPSLTNEQFDRLPYLRGTFFDHGMRLGKPLSRVTRVGESVQFSILVPPDIELMAGLKTPDGADLPRRTLTQYEADRCRIFATFPHAGRFRVHVFSRPRGAAGELKLAAELDFEATAGTRNFFPNTYPSFGAMRGYLFSPLYLPLAPGKSTSFKVRLLGAHDVSLAIGSKPWLKLTPSPSEKDVYQLTTTVPTGQRIRLNAKTSPANRSYETLIDFTNKGQ
jgi:hypothetical protein